MEKTINYKDTLQLPRTDFAMKANLPQREPEQLRRWEQLDLYQRLGAKKQGRPMFVLHDGPPYANGHIHIGHALNKILKDIILKYKTMQGFYAPYVPGWDCHGLPVEHQLFKTLQKRKDEVQPLVFRRQAQEYAREYVELQKKEFIRLGIFADWPRPYLTMSADYAGAIVRSFAALVRGGYIYRGCKPVNWCGDCETALAEAEVEYEAHTSPSIFVAFTLEPCKLPFSVPAAAAGAQLIIWTTTPWTLIGNVAAAVHPEFTYAAVRTGKRLLIIEQRLVAAVMTQAGITEYTVSETVKGTALAGLRYRHPFLSGRQGVVVTADYVSAEDGSGIVHIAPGYGAEDFQVGRRNDLPVLMEVDAAGRFLAGVESFGGMPVGKASAAVIERLQSVGALLSAGTVEHSYPHCWRCKRPIIFRATEQWFMRIDHNGLRERAAEEITRITWVPAGGQERIAAMVGLRPDWCLSRQRLWGVPIPVMYCRACGKPLLDADVIDYAAEIIAKEGSDAWFIRAAAELLPPATACACGARDFVKEQDILDVWFDSGVSHQAVLNARYGLRFPADIYLEGSDQHRGWFQSSLLTAMSVAGAAPFRVVLTHGFTVDGDGKKMSKSRGNVIAPQQITETLGADVLRLCIAAANYSDDVRMSKEILARVSESYRKIRNTIKFILGNVCDYNPERDAVAYADMLELDRWALSATNRLISRVTEAYEQYLFYQAVKHIHHFCITQMSAFYLDILKDRLYTFSAGCRERRSAQTALMFIGATLIRLIAPVTAFTAEEAYGFLPGVKEDSVFLTDWPAAEHDFVQPELEQRWQSLAAVREAVLRRLEEARGAKLIGNSLEARVTLYCDREHDAVAALLQEYRQQLPAIFLVSQVIVQSGLDSIAGQRYTINFFTGTTAVAYLGIDVDRAAGEKCVRCWNHAPGVGSYADHPGLCARCYEHVFLRSA